MAERFDELDAERLRELFGELDAELAGRGEPVRVLVAGGAALAFKWSDRSTYDVDLIGGDFPADFRRAVAAVADRNNLDSARRRWSCRRASTQPAEPNRQAPDRPNQLTQPASTAAIGCPRGRLGPVGAVVSGLCLGAAARSSTARTWRTRSPSATPVGRCRGDDYRAAEAAVVAAKVTTCVYSHADPSQRSAGDGGGGALLVR